MKRIIEGIEVNQVDPGQQNWFIVNDSRSMKSIEKNIFNVINLNGYKVYPLRGLLYKYRTKNYHFFICTDGSEEGDGSRERLVIMMKQLKLSYDVLDIFKSQAKQ